MGTVEWADDDLAVLQRILSLQNDDYQVCKGYGKGHYDSSWFCTHKFDWLVYNGIHLKQSGTFLPTDADTVYFVSAQAAAFVSCVRNASERFIGGKWAKIVGRKHIIF